MHNRRCKEMPMPLVRPTTTPLPDEIYDEWVPLLGEAELKVLLYIVRRTLGFHKGTDAISLTQFAHGITTRDGRVLDKGCGITSRATLVRALTALEKKGLISARKGRNGAGGRSVTVYGLSWMPGGAGGDPSGGGSHREPPGTARQPGWFSEQTNLVRTENQGGSPAEPTTNSTPTNSQHNRMPTRAPAREPTSPAVLACIPRGDALDGAALWQAVIDDLRGTMTRENLTMWFASAHVVAREEDVLRVGVPSAVHQHWLDRRLRGKVEMALQRLGHGHVRVAFEVRP
jgi:hypothetical protein